MGVCGGRACISLPVGLIEGCEYLHQCGRMLRLIEGEVRRHCNLTFLPDLCSKVLVNASFVTRIPCMPFMPKAYVCLVTSCMLKANAMPHTCMPRACVMPSAACIRDTFSHKHPQREGMKLAVHGQQQFGQLCPSAAASGSSLCSEVLLLLVSQPGVCAALAPAPPTSNTACAVPRCPPP